ncbi:MAG: hypothetical protein JST35_02815 [Armatimonadetes bacterium]|nr:hypothetical protein [Armatimonadota bacterium]
MVRSFLALGLLATSAWVAAQAPDVTINLDLRLNGRTALNQRNTQRLYDVLGRPSLVKLKVKFDLGLNVVINQRLQRIDNDGDPELVDEAYVEDPGVWKVGKVVAPFGQGAFLRETVWGVQGTVDVPFLNGTASLMLADSGRRRQSGVVGRIVLRSPGIGLSAAIGNHWGINGSTFALFRDVNQSPGQGAGYGAIFGLDFSKRIGTVSWRAELLRATRPERTADEAITAFDLSATTTSLKNWRLTLGYTRAVGADFYRVAPEIMLNKNISFEPMLRMRNGNLRDFSVSVHVRF